MTRADETGVRSRIVAWYHEHRAATNVAIVAIVVVLFGIAAGLGWATVQRSQVAQGSPTPDASDSPSQMPSVTARPGTAQPSQSPAPTAAPSSLLGPAYELAGFAPLPPSWGMVMVDDLNVRGGPNDDDPVIGVLNAGDIFLTLEVGPRTQVLADGLSGWVSPGPGEDLWIQTLVTPMSW